MKNRKAARILSILLCLAMLLTLPVSAESVDGTYAELKYGMRDNDDVRAMQTRLRELGYMSAYPSGGYFDDTAKAVADFQAASGLKTDKRTASSEMLALLFSDEAIAKNGAVTPADTPAPAPTTAPATDSPSQTDAPAPAYSKLTYGTRSSSAVRAMQDRLRELGYMTCDSTGGYWGETAKAVADFQAAAGLKVDKNTASAEMQQLLFSDKAPAKGGNTPAPTEPDAPVEPTTAPSAYTELRANTSSEAIRAMQARLKALGYLMANPSGGYYSATISAVEAFQRAAGLKVQGKVATVEMQQLLFSDRAPQYGDKLITTSPSPDVTPDPTASVEPTTEPTLAPADSYTALTYGMSKSDAVLAAQARLRELGYMSCAPTGNYYSLTVAAVKAFQKYAYLPVDGKTISPEMQQILFYTGDLAKLIEERKNAQSDYSKARTDITMKIGATGEQVVYMTRRLKELGYLTGSETDIYSSSVAEAVRWFQNSNGLDADGIAGPATLKKLYSDNVIDANGSMTGNDDKPVKVDGTPVKPALSAVKSVDFFSSAADKYFNRKKGTFRDGAYAIVTDVATGISYRVKRVGGYNHTDVEPATAFDTWQMYRIYGEEWAWTRHAVLVTLSDGTTLAGSANGMPHGESHISGNNMNGHTCIHFLNSRTHGSDKVDAAHQSAIRAAANCSVSSVQAKVNAQ